MTKDKTLLDALIKTRKYTTHQVAEKTGLSTKTVDRRIKKLGMGKGRAIKYYWEFTGLTEPLAYVVGAWITDGSIQYLPYGGKIRGTQFNVTSIEFADRYADCLSASGLVVRRYEIQPAKPHYKTQYKVDCNVSMFATWLVSVSAEKERIPQVILDASPEEKLRFLEGVIDGDGTVKIDGSINVRSTRAWVRDLPIVLNKLNIRNGIRLEHAPNGKLYYGITIRRKDLRALYPVLAIPLKHDRLYHAHDTRVR